MTLAWIDTDGGAVTPTEPGLYGVQITASPRPIFLVWSKDSRDWRDGAVRVQVRRFLGPLPPIPRPARPELEPARRKP